MNKSSCISISREKHANQLIFYNSLHVFCEINTYPESSETHTHTNAQTLI